MIIELIRGDITELEVDVIVNAANTSLLGGSGVDGAIHKAGGRAILEDCLEIRYKQGGCRVGEAVITTAGLLKAKKVIHTVGPRWKGGISDEAAKLRDCYINSIKLAEEHQLRTIAFPNISTGIYRFPKQKAAEIAINTIRELESDIIEKVIFVCYDERNHEIYKTQLGEL